MYTIFIGFVVVVDKLEIFIFQRSKNQLTISMTIIIEFGIDLVS